MRNFLYGVITMINLIAIASGWFVLRAIDRGEHIQLIRSSCGIDGLLDANVRGR